MLKLMKYEIKGTYRFIMMLILAVVGASTGFQLSALRGTQMMDGFPIFLPTILALIVFGAFITATFYIINSFRKELYEDRGYLTFSLPVTGKQFVGSKLLIALFWPMVIGLVMIVYNILLGSILFGSTFFQGIKDIFFTLPYTFELTVGVTGILSAALSLLLVYFSITISKVSIKNKKIGGLWFILFLLLSGVVSALTIKLAYLFPYFIDMSTFTIVKGVGIDTNIFGMYGHNIASILFSLLVVIITFFFTSYLIDKKVEI